MGPAPRTVRISRETTVGSETPQRASAYAYSFPVSNANHRPYYKRTDRKKIRSKETRIIQQKVPCWSLPVGQTWTGTRMGLRTKSVSWHRMPNSPYRSETTNQKDKLAGRLTSQKNAALSCHLTFSGKNIRDDHDAMHPRMATAAKDVADVSVNMVGASEVMISLECSVCLWPDDGGKGTTTLGLFEWRR